MKQVSFDPKFPRHSRIGLTGASCSGKSHLLQQLVDHNAQIFERGLDHIIVFYLRRNEDDFAKIARAISCEFHRGLRDLPEILERPKEFFLKQRVAFVFEDLQFKVFNSEAVGEVFSAHTHHLPLEASILISQSLYQKGAKYQTTINRNLSHAIFTRSMRTKCILPFVAKDLLPSNPSLLLEVFVEAMRRKHGKFPYLVANLEADEEEDVMFYSGLLPWEVKRIFLKDSTEGTKQQK